MLPLMLDDAAFLVKILTSVSKQMLLVCQFSIAYLLKTNFGIGLINIEFVLTSYSTMCFAISLK